MTHEIEHAAINRLERDLGLPLDFFPALEHEDDWSFVIKRHALLEAALARLLTQQTGRDSLLSVFARLDMSDTKRGKLAFAATLDAIPKADQKFIRKLSELRNTLIHDISNVTFSLADRVASMDKNQLKSFAETYAHTMADSCPYGGDVISKLDFVKKEPKVSILGGAMNLLATLQFNRELAELAEERRDLHAQYGEVFQKLLELAGRAPTTE